MVSAQGDERENAQVAQYIKQLKLDSLKTFVQSRSINLGQLSDMNGKTPLMHAASSGNKDIVEYIANQIEDCD